MVGTPIAGEFPWPPANGTSMSAFNGTDTDIRWDDPSTLSTGPATPSTYATASITVEGTPDVLTAATAIITLVGAPIPAGDTISIDSVTLTAVVAAPGVDEFDGSSADTAVVAANIATAINDGSVGTWGIVGRLPQEPPLPLLRIRMERLATTSLLRRILLWWPCREPLWMGAWMRPPSLLEARSLPPALPAPQEGWIFK